MTAKEYKELINRENHLLLDVRSETQFKICRLENSVNIPLDKMRKLESTELIEKERRGGKVFVVCRRGVDSQSAVNLLREQGIEAFNIQGGIRAWSAQIDKNFPSY